MQTAHQQVVKAKSWQERLLNLSRLSAQPRIKIYHGYGHNGCLTVFGHVLKLTSFPRSKYRDGIIRNTLALLRLFMVKPYPCINVEMHWKGKKYFTKTDKDGFYKFDWEDSKPVEKGWQEIKIAAISNGNIITAAKGHVYIPEPSQYIYISDIDDTFLISHSSDIRKRLLVLFTNNARSRKPFEGVVKHYQLLETSNGPANAPNPFFYISSSEWNLYDYLLEFTAKNNLPKGVYLLNQLKGFSELLKTGHNNHQAKFTRIVRIMEAYPKQRVILLGDSSQQDPYIYSSIVEHFPKQVHAVYIRDIYQKNNAAVAEVLRKIESKSVPCCFFKHSSEAILHSIKIGLIPADKGQSILAQTPISSF
jgi:phosphatidate phosphatase APP1